MNEAVVFLLGYTVVIKRVGSCFAIALSVQDANGSVEVLVIHVIVLVL